jgi:uncharacterized protein YceH (UPF0502 family)
MPVCLHALTNCQLNQHLEARGSRTSGSRRQREERLQRFLDFEDQKKRRNEYVEKMREAAVDECYDREPTQEDQVARVLLELRDDAEWSEYNMNRLIPRVKALEDIIASMEKRITELETADMPPLAPILQDSNPNWVYDQNTSPYPWECTQFN